MKRAPGNMQPAALIPVPFSSLSRLIATASRFCGKNSSVLKPKKLGRDVKLGEVIRLALLAPELRVPVDVKATVVARTLRPVAFEVRYELADLAQMEHALARLYTLAPTMLPVALDVATFRARPCRLSALSPEGATFEVQGELSPERCAPDTEVRLSLPHQDGRLDLPGHVAWVTPRPNRSRLHMSFGFLAEKSRQMLDDIVFRFRLGSAPWQPKLMAPGL